MDGEVLKAMAGDGPRSTLDHRALAFIRRAIGPDARLTEIAGDASTRRFYRVTTGRGSVILIAHRQRLTAKSPLYSNQRLLESIGAPVPRILGDADALGLVLVEDLGEMTLQRTLLQRPAGEGIDEEARNFYRQACDIIVLLQQRGTPALLPDDFASQNRLDRERFLFELDHFHRHFILGHMGRHPSPGDERILRAFYDDLAETCDAMPQVYCHRDFQSRNLMVEKGRLRLIDYQDARLGPHVYDAASLLRDSSLDLPEKFLEDMLAYLAHRLGEGPEEYQAQFDIMALQRNIKDLGTFGYMAMERGRREYLGYVPRTLAHVRRTLLRHHRYHLFFEAIDRLVLSGDT